MLFPCERLITTHLRDAIQIDVLRFFRVKNRQEMEPIHLEEQLGLRQRQLREVANTVKASPSQCH